MEPNDSDGELGAELDLTSDPLPPEEGSISRLSGKPANRLQVKLYFGCCRVTYTLIPPQHVMCGESNMWRVHCPRCGGLVEVLVQ